MVHQKNASALASLSEIASIIQDKPEAIFKITGRASQVLIKLNNLVGHGLLFSSVTI
jgi:hypothetical protein